MSVRFSFRLGNKQTVYWIFIPPDSSFILVPRGLVQAVNHLTNKYAALKRKELHVHSYSL